MGSDQPQLYRHPRHRERMAGISPEKTESQKQDFFQQLETVADKTIYRDRRLESFKQSEVSCSLQTYQEQLSQTQTALKQSRLQVVELQTKLDEAKTRTKKLTEILLSGEMKEKTEVLVQVHKLEKIRDELSTSLADTSARLEQERSLNTNIEAEIRKTGAGASAGEMELCARLMSILRQHKK